MTIADDRPATADEALRELIEGNDRFVRGARVHPNQDAGHRTALAREQRPFAVVFGCSDSRLAAEIIFDRGLGDLFVVRTAGHVVGAEVTASIEYGVRILGVPLVVVLGHDSCGAVRAAHDAVTGVATPSEGMLAIVDRIRPSLSAGPDLDAVGVAHIRHTVDELTRSGIGVAPCAVVGMTYRLAEGRVTVITPAPGG